MDYFEFYLKVVGNKSKGTKIKDKKKTLKKNSSLKNKKKVENKTKSRNDGMEKAEEVSKEKTE